jgi:hypothetical protein
MISLEITQFNQYAHFGNADIEENVKDECTNTITFDCENLIISARNGRAPVSDECAIMFELTPTFIKELGLLIEAIRSEYERSN